jgi:hypothetical protein
VQIFLLACKNLSPNGEKAHKVQVIYGKGPKGFCCRLHLVLVSIIGGFHWILEKSAKIYYFLYNVHTFYGRLSECFSRTFLAFLGSNSPL